MDKTIVFVPFDLGKAPGAGESGGGGGWLCKNPQEALFTPKRYQFLNNILSDINDIPEDTAKVPPVEPFELENRNRYQVPLF